MNTVAVHAIRVIPSESEGPAVCGWHEDHQRVLRTALHTTGPSLSLGMTLVYG